LPPALSSSGGPLLEEFAARTVGDRRLGEEAAGAPELIAEQPEEDLEVFADQLAQFYPLDDNGVIRLMVSEEGVAQVEHIASHVAIDELGDRLDSLAQRLTRYCEARWRLGDLARAREHPAQAQMSASIRPCEGCFILRSDDRWPSIRPA
jgi:hypothetical protein